MKAFKKLLLIAALFTAAAAQTPEPPLNDSRLSIHTLVREDIFAGFLTDDLERMARGERNIETLLEKRPSQRAELLSWKAGATLYRAVRAHENNKPEEYKRLYRQAVELFNEAGKLSPRGDGVAAVTGGSYVPFSDKLAREDRAEAWNRAYDAFQILWKQQSSVVDRLPVHIRGELLGGIAQSAQRTGRAEEAMAYADKIIAAMPGTPYETVAKKWKLNPEAASKTSITCLTCHESGRLSARMTALDGK